jgi:hypothetical protein
VLRLLVAEDNNAADRRRVADVAGATPGESYAKVLRSLAPEALVDICTPADADAAIPAPLEVYNGVVFTGSALVAATNCFHARTVRVRRVGFRLLLGTASSSRRCWRRSWAKSAWPGSCLRP